MKKLFIVTVAILGLTLTSCTKDSCLEDKQAEIEKYDRLIQQAQGDPVELQIIYRNRAKTLSQFDC